MKIIPIALVAALTLVSAEPGFAQTDPQPPQYDGFGGPNAIDRQIESDRQRRGTLFETSFLDPYWAWKDRIRERDGFTYGAEYNATFLTSSDRLPGADRAAAGGIFRYSGSWELFGRDTDHSGSLLFLLEHTHDYTKSPSGFVIESAGAVGVSNLPYNDEGWRLNTLYWNQKFQGGRYEVVGGFLDISDYVDVYPLVSPWTDFFNLSFSIGAGTLDIPNDGALGLAGGAWLSDSVYAIAGLVDLNADAERPWKGFETAFSDHEYFSHFEIGWTGASQEAYFLDNVHLTLWHTDDRAGLESGYGAVLSFNHSIGDKWLVFVRAGYADDGGSLLGKSVSIGGGYTPSGLETLGAGSQLGFGASWGEPNDALFGSGLDDQYTIESYYRLQVTRELAITPSVQLLIDPALDPDESALWVFGIRARVAF